MEIFGFVVGEAWGVESNLSTEVLLADFSSADQRSFEFSVIYMQQAFVVVFPARQMRLLQYPVMLWVREEYVLSSGNLVYRSETC